MLMLDNPHAGAAPAQRIGHVALVGAGPGDPELLTLKGLRLLRAADVIIYDRLVDASLLDEARPDAERIYVGKGPRCHTLAQNDINALLVTHAQLGRAVVRLKGGDPFVFGRGGEEAAALSEAGVPFEVVPGVSAAIAVPAYAGIPVTHRGVAPLVSIVTGHTERDDGVPHSDTINWEALAAAGGTLVVLMGVASLPYFTQRLIAAGMATDTPAAVIERGTTTQQRVISAPLGVIAERAAAAGFGSPATTVIGAVAALHNSLAWYESIPIGA